MASQPIVDHPIFLLHESSEKSPIEKLSSRYIGGSNGGCSICSGTHFGPPRSIFISLLRKIARPARIEILVITGVGAATRRYEAPEEAAMALLEHGTVELRFPGNVLVPAKVTAYFTFPTADGTLAWTSWTSH